MLHVSLLLKLLFVSCRTVQARGDQSGDVSPRCRLAPGERQQLPLQAWPRCVVCKWLCWANALLADGFTAVFVRTLYDIC